jgi:transcriptional regulator with XRE-family HTH domain
LARDRPQATASGEAIVEVEVAISPKPRRSGAHARSRVLRGPENGHDAARPAAPLDDTAVDQARVALGRRVRALRSDRGISGRTLASQIGVTSGFISQLEAGTVSPSVATLVKLAGVLDVKVGDLFDAPQPVGMVLRRDERVPYEYPGLGFIEERLCMDPRMEVVYCDLSPGAATGRDDLFTHGADLEFALILKGKVRFFLGEEEYLLSAGDSVTFPGDVPHGCENPSSKLRAELIWVITPGTF